jgi:hypothetical protein
MRRGLGLGLGVCSAVNSRVGVRRTGREDQRPGGGDGRVYGERERAVVVDRVGETTPPRRNGFRHEDGGLVNERAGGDVGAGRGS